MIDVLLGLQWGDEGKGKIVDYLADQYQMVARFQGGPNAGHTLVLGGIKYVLHTVPSGIFRANVLNLVGNGVVLDPITFERELQLLEAAGVPEFRQRLLISNKAHLILPTHRLLDAVYEADKGLAKIGSTLRGIGPTYTDKIARQGLRVGDIFQNNFQEKYNELKAKHLRIVSAYNVPVSFDLETEETKFWSSLNALKNLQCVNAEYVLDKLIKAGKSILAEGAQGSMLDIDFGTYPFVTSSNTVTAGVCTGLGVSPTKIREVIGITKAYCTRVGSGAFPTELDNEVGERIRQAGGEFGATTGRSRRCGWLDLVQLNYTILLNGVTQLVMTKADVLNDFEEIYAATAYQVEGQETTEMPFDLNYQQLTPIYKKYAGWRASLGNAQTLEQLPAPFQLYLKEVENYLQVPFKLISTGPAREELIIN